MFDPTAQFELQVLPNGRSAADEYLHQGAIWIEGRESSRYVLKFTNKSAGRVNVVFSVDGLDTIKGQPAGPNSQGYVVNAWDSVEVPGWLLDTSTAAEFYFAKAGKSYVASSGQNTSNTGVIGAMVFKEQQPNYYQYNTTVQPVASGWYPGATPIANPQPWGIWHQLNPSNGAVSRTVTIDTIGQNSQQAGAAVAPTTSVYHSQPVERRVSLDTPQTATLGVKSSVASVSQDVGTGFGNATEFTTVTAQFNRANATQPDAILAIYYNTLQNLQKMGIQVKTARINYATASSANPFPTYSPGCKPPGDWKP